jgi:4'-phosphopantetheinyl transferase EntD
MKGGPLRVVVLADPGGSIDRLLERLTHAERRAANSHATERRRRHFALARLAAREALGTVLESSDPPPVAEVLPGSKGEPVVLLDGKAGQVYVALSHSGRLAAAVAWSGGGDGYALGIDLEKDRPSEVAWSAYAFSDCERQLIARLPGDRGQTGLAAWAVKEAAWKALRPEPHVGPEMLEIRELDVARGRAQVDVFGDLRARLGHLRLDTRVQRIRGPDGAYFLALAEILPPPERGKMPGGSFMRVEFASRFLEPVAVGREGRDGAQIPGEC